MKFLQKLLVKIANFKLLLQIIKFCLVGLFNTFLSYSIYTGYYFFIHSNEYIANAVAFIISVFSAFLLQSKFVFQETPQKQQRVWWKVLLKTYIAYAFSGLFLTTILIFFWIRIIQLENYLTFLSNFLGHLNITITNHNLAISIIPFLNLAITIPTNFIINKYWAYNQENYNQEN